jgi:hypothetical protein
MKPEQVLAEIEEVIRLMPPSDTMGHHTPEVLAWVGRATATIDAWVDLLPIGRSSIMVNWESAVQNLHSRPSYGADPSVVIQRILYQAQSALRLATVGPVNVAVGSGQPFQYFDQVRKIMKEAAADVFCVDPYLNDDFVARYLPSINDGVTIRLLTSNNQRTAKTVSGLRAAADLYTKEFGALVMVRTAGDLHDRWLFIDRRRAFHSGASFKDGGVKSATVLTENVDTFNVVVSHYEKLWTSSCAQEQ